MIDRGSILKAVWLFLAMALLIGAPSISIRTTPQEIRGTILSLKAPKALRGETHREIVVSQSGGKRVRVDICLRGCSASNLTKFRSSDIAQGSAILISGTTGSKNLFFAKNIEPLANPSRLAGIITKISAERKRKSGKITQTFTLKQNLYGGAQRLTTVTICKSVCGADPLASIAGEVSLSPRSRVTVDGKTTTTSNFFASAIWATGHLPQPTSTPIPGPTVGPYPLDSSPAPIETSGSICRSASTLDIFDADGNIDPAAYRDLASKIATVDGQNYRLGHSYSFYHPTTESFPNIYKPDDQLFPHDAPNVYYQLGTLLGSPGGYNSTNGQVIFAPTDPSYPGLDTLQTLGVGWGIVEELPMLPWTLYGFGHPDPSVSSDPRWTSSLVSQFGRSVGHAVGMGRGNGMDIWGLNAVVAFDSGIIGTTGTYASGGTSTVGLQLPPNKIPTSVSVTNSSEFALVTIWDTEQIKGQLAVIALGGPKTPGFGDDWTEIYPGLWNVGLTGFMKLLGFIDLPDMVAPVEVSAVTDLRSPQLIMVKPPSQMSLSDESNRLEIANGSLTAVVPKSGYAVVMSRSEKKVTFVDLQPLIQYFSNMYFGTHDDFLLTRNMGQNPNEWPYTFEIAPSSMPQVVKTVTFDNCPSAIKASLNVRGPYQIPASATKIKALVGTVDGTLHTFSIGGLYDDSVASPSDISEIASTRVGRNPTDIAYQKGLTNNFFVVSRGDRRIDFVKGDPDTGTFTIQNTLRDERMVDPVSVEDGTYFGNVIPLISVSDFDGQQILNYRYDDAVLHFYIAAYAQAGLPPPVFPINNSHNLSGWEFGGAYATTGHAFKVTNTNVP